MSGKNKVKTYHRRIVLHDADHLNVNPFLTDVLQQTHHLGQAQPFAVRVTHSNNVVALFQTISLEQEQKVRGVKGWGGH